MRLDQAKKSTKSTKHLATHLCICASLGLLRSFRLFQRHDLIEHQATGPFTATSFFPAADPGKHFTIRSAVALVLARDDHARARYFFFMHKVKLFLIQPNAKYLSARPDHGIVDLVCQA